MTAAFKHMTAEQVDALMEQILTQGIPSVENVRVIVIDSMAQVAEAEAKAVANIETMERLIYTLGGIDVVEPDWDCMDLDRKAYKPVPKPQMIRRTTLNMNRPVVRSMRSVNRNR